jgi:hypothetical protein
MADEPTAPAALSDDPALKAIQLEEATAKRDSAVAAARKAGADADKATTDASSAATAAKYPAASVKAPEGKVDVGDKAGLVADLIAHSMLDPAADRVAAELFPEAAGDRPLNGESRVLMVDSTSLVGSDWPYMAISKQISQEKTELEAIAKKLGGTAPAGGTKEVRSFALGAAAVGSIVGGAASVVSLLRGDYAISARDVSVGSPPLFAVLANRLIAKGVEVNLDEFGLLAKSKLFGTFNEAAEARVEVQRLAAEAKERVLVPSDRLHERAKEARSAYVTALGSDKVVPGLEALKQEAESLERKIGEEAAVAATRGELATAEAAIARFDAFAAAITKAPDDGYPPLVAAAIRERLHAAEDRYTHVLFAAVESAGGETLTRRTIWKTTLRFMGGAQVSYLLWNVATERLVAANTMPVLGEAKMDLVEGKVAEVSNVPLTQP